MVTSDKKNKKLVRLKKRADFLLVQSSGQKWISKGMIIQLRANDGLGLRVGLTVTKRVSKLAVFRNRVKRRLKAVSEEILPSYQTQNLDIILVGRALTKERNYQDLRQDLAWSLKKMNVKMDEAS